MLFLRIAGIPSGAALPGLLLAKLWVQLLALAGGGLAAPGAP